MDEEGIFTVRGPAWLWRAEPPAKGAWHFLRIEGNVAAEIRFLTFENARGFGSVPVWATIGETRWKTSLFRAGQSGGYLLPLKADVRKREGIEEGDEICARLEV